LLGLRQSWQFGGAQKQILPGLNESWETKGGT